MTRVIRHRCDNCQREAEPIGLNQYPADGWWTVTGEWGGGEPYDEHHLCSLDCIVEWAGTKLGQAMPSSTLAAAVEAARKTYRTIKPGLDVTSPGIVRHGKADSDGCACGDALCPFIAGSMSRRVWQ